MTGEQNHSQLSNPECNDELRFDAAATPPDLIVEIRNPNGDDQTFQCLVRTRLLDRYRHGKVEEWRLSGRAADIVADYMSGFTRDGASNLERLASMEGAGIALFQAAPEYFKEVFWALIDAGKTPKTIFISSQERNIPWELMIPQRERDDGTEELRDPLGVEFNIGRWQEDCPSPSQLSPLDNSRVLAPEYIGELRLPKASEEAKFVCDHFNGVKINPALFESMDSQLDSWTGSLLHFVCHGAASTTINQEIILEGGQILSSIQLLGARGVRKACRANRPVVFLNACEVGRPAPALIGVGGFAKSFVNLKARAVIAPLWSVKDSIAHEVAIEFYRRVMAEPLTPFGEILRRIRAKAYGDSGGEDTYAAYCMYGDPLLSATRP